ncbi:hypothetical protein [Clostridium perfringens]|uniref:hypothetical protein n=1 Tax=Clostridium perfringens TaxID=1502 RepID=UPI0024438D87|nr:hypothetical protein [Clostridium perfringens]MDG6891179.1 hypothetical protein [Clostridium perfringens]
MTNLERLKLELSNKKYYKDSEYSVFLEENNLVPTGNYVKANNEINLLKTVVSVLETLANDTDIMRKIDNKDIMSIDQAYKFLEKRIYRVNTKIIELQEIKDGTNLNIRPIFFS